MYGNIKHSVSRYYHLNYVARCCVRIAKLLPQDATVQTEIPRSEHILVGAVFLSRHPNQRGQFLQFSYNLRQVFIRDTITYQLLSE